MAFLPAHRIARSIRTGQSRCHGRSRSATRTCEGPDSPAGCRARRSLGRTSTLRHPAERYTDEHRRGHAMPTDYSFLVDTYASERLKTLSVWAMFDDADLDVRPH